MYHVPIYWNKDRSKKKKDSKDESTEKKGATDNEAVKTLTNKLDPHDRLKSINRRKEHNILFISPNLPEFDESAGGKRAWHMLKLLQEEYNVYAYAPGSRKSHHKKKLEDDGVIVFDHHDYERIKREVPGFHTIIYAWYYTYYDCEGFRNLYPDALIIVDTVDIHWVREERSLGNWDGINKEKWERNKLSEMHVYENADIIWTVSDTDTAAIHKEIPTADIRVVSIIEDLKKHTYVDPETKNILFLGGYRHYPNINAAQILAEEIMPLIVKKEPKAKLLLAGSGAPDDIIALGKSPHVEYLGFIEDEDIAALYGRAALTIVPLISGAGVKGKICEAISYRVPVITNKIGNEGINLKNKVDAFITEKPTQMAKYALSILSGKYDLPGMTTKAQAKLLNLVGPEVNKQNMVHSIHRPVSICIVTYNKVDLLEKCIESILDNTDYPDYEVLVHSNGCEDGTKEYLEALAKKDPRIIPILSDDNDVFVKPNNWMMERSVINDIVLLNNDTTVTKGWLTALKDAAYASPTIGIAGSKILYPDGKLQEFGGELYSEGGGRNIGKWEDPNEDQYNILKRAAFVSGCSFFIKRSTIDKVGVFDLQFHPCYCEDADYCYNAWRNELETVVTPKSIIYHFEGATSGTDTSSGFKRFQDINMKKFHKKHGKHIDKINEKVSVLNG